MENNIVYLPTFETGSALTEGIEYYEKVVKNMKKYTKTRMGSRALYQRVGGKVVPFVQSVWDEPKIKNRPKYFDALRKVDIHQIIPPIENELIGRSSKFAISFSVVECLSFSLLTDLNIFFYRASYYSDSENNEDGDYRRLAMDILDEIFKIFPSIMVDFIPIYEEFTKIVKFFSSKFSGWIKRLENSLNSLRSYRKDSFMKSLFQAIECQKTGKLDLSQLPTDVFFHKILKFLEIRDIIPITGTSKIFFTNIWNHTLKSMKSKNDRQYFTLFRKSYPNFIPDDLLSKLIDADTLDTGFLFEYTFPFLFEQQYEGSLKSIARKMRKNGKLNMSITDTSCRYYDPENRWKVRNLVFSIPSFSTFVNRRWGNSTFQKSGKCSEIMSFLRFAKHLNPKFIFSQKVCKHILILFKNMANLEDLKAGVLLAYQIFAKPPNFFHIFIRVFSNIWQSKSSFFEYGLDLLISNPPSIITINNKGEEELKRVFLNDVFLEKCCVNFVSQRWKRSLFLLKHILSRLGRHKNDPSFNNNRLLLASCVVGDEETVKFLLSFESVVKKGKGGNSFVESIKRAVKCYSHWDVWKRNEKLSSLIRRLLMCDDVVDPSFDANFLLKLFSEGSLRDLEMVRFLKKDIRVSEKIVIE